MPFEKTVQIGNKSIEIYRGDARCDDYWQLSQPVMIIQQYRHAEDMYGFYTYTEEHRSSWDEPQTIAIFRVKRKVS